MKQQLANWEYTKIVATIGPASDTPELLESLIQAGMNVARLNTKHGTTEWHAERIDRIREASNKSSKHIAILLDLQGPEIRINLRNKESFQVEQGEQVALVASLSAQPAKQIQVPQEVIDKLQVGNAVLVEDGSCEFTVVSKDGGKVMLESDNSCMCNDRKTLNCPGVVFNMPSLIPDDLEKMDMAAKHPVDFIALSFVRNTSDIKILRDEMKARNIEADVIAKIENQAAIDNLDEIIQASDAVMVARGDLAVEIPMEQITYWQKEMIHRCRALGKPVITATQMLKSMVDNSRPTRAEVSDVANAVFDGTDAIMLSEETTVGKYPVKTVQTMRKIAKFNEPHARASLQKAQSIKSKTTAVTKMATSLLSDEIEPVDLVLVLTETGFTAQQLARHRANVPVIAVSDRQHTVQKLSLSYGIQTLHHEFPDGKIEDIKHLVERLKQEGYLDVGEKLLVIHGTIHKQPGLTNTVTLMEVE